jgi:OmpA-OmpF porin, OOP family
MNRSMKLGALAVPLMLAFGSQAVFAKEIQTETKKVAGSVNLQTITLKGDTLFKFGDDQLSPAGKKALDDLVKSGKLDPMTRYRIEGHTDNIGDKSDNGKLSVRRADTVRKYLLSRNSNLRLESGGKGEASPVVQCSDKLPKEKLVKCLAPNRRVTIDPIN